MKQILLLIALAVGFTACDGTSKKQSKSGDATETAAQNTTKVTTLDELMATADSNIGKRVSVAGFVTHTCKHSGRRCFLQGETKNYTIRVEATGDLGGFNRELIGSKVEMTGTLRERRLSPAEIGEMENKITSKEIADNGSAESCDTETANIKMMRDWMKEHGKDYYAIYYIDGESYEVIE